MTFTTVEVLMHATSPQTFDDHVDDNGRFVNLGVQALAALKAHKAIDVFMGDPGEELIIPYHAVMSYSVTKAEGEYTRPDDDFCKPIECPTAPICPDDSDDSGDSDDDSSVKRVIYRIGSITNQSDLKTIQEIFDYLAQAYDVNGMEVTPKEGYGGLIVVDENHIVDMRNPEFGTTWSAINPDTIDSGVLAESDGYICQILPSGINIVSDN